MERGALPLRDGEGGEAGGCDLIEWGKINKESDRGNHGLGMDDLRNCQGRGVAQQISKASQCPEVGMS